MTELLVQNDNEMELKLPLPELTHDEFFDFCAANSDYRIERTAEGKITIMAGTGGETGNLNAELTAQLHMWAKTDRRGVAFDSGTMFLLPNGAMRSPDAAWVLRSRWVELSKETRRRFVPLCPEFLVELTSPSDRLPAVQRKMSEWMAEGCQLGWIIHPPLKTVHVYRPGCEVEILEEPTQVVGEGPVAGFTLDMASIWNPDLD
jgi:Uma2 family endonuclease